MNKDTKTFLNSLKCPVCQGQIDMYDLYQQNAKSTRFNFCCVNDYYHYRMALLPLMKLKIHYDMVDIYEGKYQFRTYQNYIQNKTVIDIWKVDEEHNLLNEKSKMFRYDKILFNWQNTNQNKIVNRIQTILTFQ
jgi:hypothetical protein